MTFHTQTTQTTEVELRRISMSEWPTEAKEFAKAILRRPALAQEMQLSDHPREWLIQRIERTQQAQAALLTLLANRRKET